MPASASQQEVTGALEQLRLDVLAEMERRDLNATGAMSESIEVDVAQDAQGTTGTLSAFDYWVNIGSGTPPGSDVKERDIKAWMEAKGFEDANVATAFFIARKIRRDGSKAYRQGLPNAFETAIDAWEMSALVRNLGSETANEYGDSFVEILRTNLND